MNDCYALADAASMILMILVFAFFIFPLFITIFIPHPQLIEDYRESLAKVQPLFINLIAIIVLSSICAYVTTHIDDPKNTHNIYKPTLFFFRLPPHCEGGSNHPQPAAAGARLHSAYIFFIYRIMMMTVLNRGT